MSVETPRDYLRPDNPKHPKKSRPPDFPPVPDAPSGSDRTISLLPSSLPLHVPSYQEKLLGKLAQVQDTPKEAPVDLLAAKLTTLSYRNNDPQCPDFTIDSTFKNQLVSTWQQALIVKVLGRSIGYKALYTRIHQLWKPKGALNILDLGSEYFLIQFTTDDGRTNVLANGPWMIKGHYLTVLDTGVPPFHSFHTQTSHLGSVSGAASYVLQ
ncbi:hypothetical protein K2173_012229 [Erythroxylum novogranatense]|uniref:DUF4283 domain-containing protein n=1 Tax=Erythroxylum novogranatense TaxID=1862640 RepID=A0AAV8T7S2_9ROSI|nr:hypothetical protein K2173_012229 [Erythroxylum novogranatense]